MRASSSPRSSGRLARSPILHTLQIWTKNKPSNSSSNETDATLFMSGTVCLVAPQAGPIVPDSLHRLGRLRTIPMYGTHVLLTRRDVARNASNVLLLGSPDIDGNLGPLPPPRAINSAAVNLKSHHLILYSRSGGRKKTS